MARGGISPETRARLEAGRDKQVRQYEEDIRKVFDHLGGEIWMSLAHGRAIDAI